MLFASTASMDTVCGDYRRNPNLNGDLSVMVYTIPNIPAPPPSGPLSEVNKTTGFARFIFLSRIVPNKGLKFAVEQLKPFADSCELLVYGPKENQGYYNECLQAAGKLHIDYRGSVDPSIVVPTLSQGHNLILPTWSENFCYVAFEAMGAGCPILISDQTPWQNLRLLGGGLEISLDDPIQWQSAIRELIDMDNGDYQDMREGAALRAHRWYRANFPQLKASYLHMFKDAVSRG